MSAVHSNHGYADPLSSPLARNDLCSHTEFTSGTGVLMIQIHRCAHAPNLAFWHPFSKLCPNWLRHWRGANYLSAPFCQNRLLSPMLSVPSIKLANNMGTRTVESAQC